MTPFPHQLRTLALIAPALILCGALSPNPLFAQQTSPTIFAAASAAPAPSNAATAYGTVLPTPAIRMPSGPAKGPQVASSAPITAGASTDQVGYASWYGGRFHGRLTASGQVYDMNKLTAANKTLPFGTKVQVTNLENNESVVVTINDRGPFVAGRIIDLSRAAAEAIGLTAMGVAKVRLHIIKLGNGQRVAENAGGGGTIPVPVRSTSADFGNPTLRGGAASGNAAPVVVQVGAFRVLGNAVRLKNFLSQNGFSPLYEKWGSMTRVVLVSVPEAQLPSVKERLKKIGISSILIRHE